MTTAPATVAVLDRVSPACAVGHHADCTRPGDIPCACSGYHEAPCDCPHHDRTQRGGAQASGVPSERVEA